MAVEHINERDIDIMLAEEFEVSSEFAAWFLKKTKFSDIKASVKDVFVSKCDNMGESDIVVVFKKDDGESRFALLIEDKIDAQFQPDQEKRYRDRAKAAIGRKEYSDYEVVLCSPQKYHDAHRHEATFDVFVSYEAIRDFLKSCDPKDGRSIYRAEFIATAAKKSSNSWVRVDDPITNDFWAAAHNIAKKDFPELEMHPPRLTKGSSWITLRPKDMPTHPVHIYISLKCDKGHVDLTFTGSRFAPFSQKVQSLLENGMTVHQTGKSAAVRITVENFEVSPPDEIVLSKVRSGFAACVRLINFYRANREFLDQAAAAARGGRLDRFGYKGGELTIVTPPDSKKDEEKS